MEFLPVEFAKDIELQTVEDTTKSMTTQQHVGRYLAQHRKDVCVVNTGLHDAQLDDQERNFARNVFVYLELIKPGCDRIVWITGTAVRGDRGKVQNNDDILRRNRKVMEILAPAPGVSVVDVFEPSLTWEHADNVHLAHSWYQLLGANLLDNKIEANRAPR